MWCWNPYFNCGKHSKREAYLLPEMQLIQIVQKYDSNQDLSLNIEEFGQFVAQTQPEINVHTEFAKIDANGDGQITLNEIDPKLF